ncbi:MAG: SWIM zinc finger family protein [Candidatus Limnocylindrales bacterium]
MHSSLIGKIEKAHRYARETDRITFQSLALEFRGDNDTHRVSLDTDRWQCTCHFFESWGGCVHVMALQQILGQMLSAEAQTSLLSREGTPAGATA